MWGIKGKFRKKGSTSYRNENSHALSDYLSTLRQASISDACESNRGCPDAELTTRIAASNIALWNQSSSTLLRISLITLKSNPPANISFPIISPKLFGALGRSMPISSSKEPNNKQPVPTSLPGKVNGLLDKLRVKRDSLAAKIIEIQFCSWSLWPLGGDDRNSFNSWRDLRTDGLESKGDWPRPAACMPGMSPLGIDRVLGISQLSLSIPGIPGIFLVPGIPGIIPPVPGRAIGNPPGPVFP
ncbi:hypothetical protein G2W53_038704 [Senna tora]|uniref:Uncharacterized protein n=1 Tax=Senna tora TaxID=362788 RepID=A0A834SLH0_9FABA|nr:hypothetical protein G2W53_038704 [Senna tora]